MIPRHSGATGTKPGGEFTWAAAVLPAHPVRDRTALESPSPGLGKPLHGESRPKKEAAVSRSGVASTRKSNSYPTVGAGALRELVLSISNELKDV